MISNERKKSILLNVIKELEEATLYSAKAFMLGLSLDKNEINSFYSEDLNADYKSHFSIAANMIEEFEESTDQIAGEYLKGEGFTENEIEYLLSSHTYEDYILTSIKARSDLNAYTDTDLIFHIELGDDEDVESFNNNLLEIHTSLVFDNEIIQDESGTNICVLTISFDSKQEMFSNIISIENHLNKIDEIC